ncbi:CLUMA_CG003583, isoform A [Clunio marinus]|uniref:CLUMA_CG003583, isoform A n=1 Tax=Clunio marinus TaxID=568069 RepID=A0A1J1HPE6_9DIPT|nr:CLUMA_CG003583, isoform A [Clunio marinus]
MTLYVESYGYGDLDCLECDYVVGCFECAAGRIPSHGKGWDDKQTICSWLKVLIKNLGFTLNRFDKGREEQMKIC